MVNRRAAGGGDPKIYLYRTGRAALSAPQQLPLILSQFAN